MTPQEFVAKWKRANLSERSACQQHFLDLCDVLGQPTPAKADPDGAFYTFERGVSKTGGGKGWADVWFRGHFGWEYKGKHKDLDAAYRQLLLYREDLENPPLLVVCDLDRFEIHTNFTGTAKRVYAFDLDALGEPANLDALRKLFIDPEALKPGETTRGITEQAAERFGLLADGMRLRGVAAQRAAHFLMKLMFCMFAEDIGLLPPKLFNRVLLNGQHDPPRLADRLGGLFQAMTTGGDFGADQILHFNGGLFADADVIELKPKEIEELILVNEHDWASVEPSIFGTLFERTLDPAKRTQIGAHYTSREDILTLLEPVVMTPLRHEWAGVREKCEKLWPKIQAAAARSATKVRAAKESADRRKFDRLLLDFEDHLAHVTILDPACGSGNFLYVAINLLLDLEKEVITYAAAHDTSLVPKVRPTQLAGIEINPYAQQLAQVVIWIGYLQWIRDNGFNAPADPVLEPIDTIELKDAIIDADGARLPREAKWPDADFIVGNPPFLGGKLLRANLGDEYVATMFQVWDDRVPREADLCCYWFEKARDMIRRGRCQRAGLLATQGIRGGANRKVLEAIKKTGDIFFGVSDRDWILDGATVHVSMVGFDNRRDKSRLLDGKPVKTINANLRATADTTTAQRLHANLRLSFMGDTKGGAFDVSEPLALEMLQQPNPSGRPNSDIVTPWANGLDVVRRARNVWIIDFGATMVEYDAAMYEAPFEHVRMHVKPERDTNKRQSYREKWWLHVEPRPAMRDSLRHLSRFAVTISVGKHRLFAWMCRPTLPDHQLFAFVRSDDYFFGLLHSHAHEVWARAQGTQLREVESGFRYTASTCFETFPVPQATDTQAAEIAKAAKELDHLRCNWLNPPEWTREELLEFPGSDNGPWSRYVADADSRGIGTVRYPRLVAKDDDYAKQLAKRTLTNLYNERPAWLDNAHRRLDEAVFAAYDWPADLTDDEILAELLELNLAREPVG